MKTDGLRGDGQSWNATAIRGELTDSEHELRFIEILCRNVQISVHASLSRTCSFPL